VVPPPLRVEPSRVGHRRRIGSTEANTSRSQSGAGGSGVASDGGEHGVEVGSMRRGSVSPRRVRAAAMSFGKDSSSRGRRCTGAAAADGAAGLGAGAAAAVLVRGPQTALAVLLPRRVTCRRLGASLLGAGCCRGCFGAASLRNREGAYRGKSSRDFNSHGASTSTGHLRSSRLQDRGWLQHLGPTAYCGARLMIDREADAFGHLERERCSDILRDRGSDPVEVHPNRAGIDSPCGACRLAGPHLDTIRLIVVAIW